MLSVTGKPSYTGREAVFHQAVYRTGKPGPFFPPSFALEKESASTDVFLQLLQPQYFI